MPGLPARKRHVLFARRVHRAFADGGFAEYLLTTERSLVKLAPGLDPADVVPHADAGLTAYHAVLRLLTSLVLARHRS